MSDLEFDVLTAMSEFDVAKKRYEEHRVKVKASIDSAKMADMKKFLTDSMDRTNDVLDSFAAIFNKLIGNNDALKAKLANAEKVAIDTKAMQDKANVIARENAVKIAKDEVLKRASDSKKKFKVFDFCVPIDAKHVSARKVIVEKCIEAGCSEKDMSRVNINPFLPKD